MYINYYHQINGFDNLFGNIFAFVPFGVLLPLVFKRCNKVWYILINGAWFSLLIELFQLITRFGEFDVDDIMLNTFGALLGYLLLISLRFIMLKKNNFISQKEHK